MTKNNILFSYCTGNCGNECYHWSGKCKPCRDKEKRAAIEKAKQKARELKENE